MRRRRIPPREDAVCHVSAGRDKLGLDIHYINAFKGRGIFTTVLFQKGDFLLEYRGKLITKEECERRHRVYHDSLKVFMFEFKFDGKLWCVDTSQEDGSLGRLVNDNHISPSAKMKIKVQFGLVCTTISSLDKCIQCVGPVSSFKWLGYKCKGETFSE
ncbi:LOW QUALITY PROTEIN: histone-lysine N-methyltransferase set-1-like [Neolamprologus brichardi]|uniref:LOW QUALITY PROTEIN: histone-lysine N-methyltransferase set-1-like n=1 Tax=Neolamprologus brichardi TaxID=32507 RepID=UPI001643F239|nr:LOW QUALITY PROTEIN: histone-lysine N-methyltransferase set-1-like [Neolamprologus brichardi]